MPPVFAVAEAAGEMASSMPKLLTALSTLANALITSRPGPTTVDPNRLPFASVSASSVAACTHAAGLCSGEGGGKGDGQQHAQAADCHLHPRQRPHHEPPPPTTIDANRLPFASNSATTV